MTPSDPSANNEPDESFDWNSWNNAPAIRCEARKVSGPGRRCCIAASRIVDGKHLCHVHARQLHGQRLYPQRPRKVTDPEIFNAVEQAVRAEFNWVLTDLPYDSADLDRMARSVALRTSEILVNETQP